MYKDGAKFCSQETDRMVPSEYFEGKVEQFVIFLFSVSIETAISLQRHCGDIVSDNPDIKIVVTAWHTDLEWGSDPDPIIECASIWGHKR
jgi:hypothetical protein